jgi:hypothetical protein
MKPNQSHLFRKLKMNPVKLAARELVANKQKQLPIQPEPEINYKMFSECYRMQMAISLSKNYREATKLLQMSERSFYRKKQKYHLS